MATSRPRGILAHQGLEVLDDHGDPVGTADALEAVGAIAARGRNVEQAARLLGAAERLRQETGIRRFPLEADRFTEHANAARSSLGDQGFDRAWAEGVALPGADAVAYARRGRGERALAGQRGCIGGRYLEGLPTPAQSIPTRVGAGSLSTGTFTEPDTHGREAVLRAPTLIREDRTQRGKCCVSSSSIRSHSNQTKGSPFIALSTSNKRPGMTANGLRTWQVSCVAVHLVGIETSLIGYKSRPLPAGQLCRGVGDWKGHRAWHQRQGDSWGVLDRTSF